MPIPTSGEIDAAVPVAGTPLRAQTNAVLKALAEEVAVAQVGRAPVALAASTTLTEAAHANRELFVTSASALTLTLPATAATGARFFGVNLGAGVLSLVLNGGGSIPANGLLPPTVDQFSAFEIKRHAGGFVRVA